MFTGIIEEVGQVMRITHMAAGARLWIAASTVLQDTQIGDSISTNGVCLTVTERTETSFAADVMGETLRRSTLGFLQAGASVNLERAMAVGGRFGGHIVTGHIDGTGKVAHTRKEGNAVWFTIVAGPQILRYIIEKGSVAIDGISLTVASVDEHKFAVSVIPHTGAMTTLLNRTAGELVNLECDMVGKYVDKLIGTTTPHKQEITTEFLKRYGY